MISWNEAVVRVFKVGFQRNHGFGGEFFDLSFEDADVSSFLLEFFEDRGEELFMSVWVYICEVVTS